MQSIPQSLDWFSNVLALIRYSLIGSAIGKRVPIRTEVFTPISHKRKLSNCATTRMPMGLLQYEACNLIINN